MVRASNNIWVALFEMRSSWQKIGKIQLLAILLTVKNRRLSFTCTLRYPGLTRVPLPTLNVSYASLYLYSLLLPSLPGIRLGFWLG